MRRFFDYYAILNLPTNASAEMIRVAYEVRMIELCAGDLSPVERERRVALLKLAFHVLGDEERRLAYDVNGECGYWDEPDDAEEPANADAFDEPQKPPIIRPARRRTRAARTPGLAERLLRFLRGARIHGEEITS